nr:MAG TPA: hypothetical protein [Crassvirales sp.]
MFSSKIGSVRSTELGHKSQSIYTHLYLSLINIY